MAKCDSPACWPRMPSERVRFRDGARRGDSCRAQCRPSPR